MSKATAQKKGKKGKQGAKKTPTAAKKKTTKKPRPEKAPIVTAEIYNQMWFAYMKVQNIAVVAREVGVTHRTAKKYIVGPAAPEYGMVPIRERFNRVQSRAQQEQELDLLSFRRKEQSNALSQLNMMHGEMQLAFADVRQRLEKYKKDKAQKPDRELNLKDLVATYERAARHVEHLLGGPDLTVGGVATFDPLNNLTDEEAQEYVTTGRLPQDIDAAMAQLEQEDS